MKRVSPKTTLGFGWKKTAWPLLGFLVTPKNNLGMWFTSSFRISVETSGKASGRVLEINETLLDAPEKLNESPLQDGWLFKLEPVDEAEFEDLMDDEDYADFVDSAG